MLFFLQKPPTNTQNVHDESIFCCKNTQKNPETFGISAKYTIQALFFSVYFNFSLQITILM